MPAKSTIAVLGAGAWGTALAVLLARNGYPVRLWGHDPAHVAQLARERKSVTLPDVSLPPAIDIGADLGATLRDVHHLLIAVPSHAFASTLERLRPQLSSPSVLAWATKGLAPGTSELLSQVASNVLPEAPSRAVITGPTFAGEIARGLPAALTVASENAAVAESVAAWLRNDRVRVYTTDDVIGVQLGGAIKNVMAIAAGISDGLGFGANARAALITRGLAELTRLGMALGGKRDTFMGLAGAGDLILTCTDNASRNRRVGLGLGQGKKLEAVLKEIGQEAEGVNTARELHRLANKLGVDMPITHQVYRILYEDVAPAAAVEALLKREPKQTEGS